MKLIKINYLIGTHKILQGFSSKVVVNLVINYHFYLINFIEYYTN